MPPSLPDADVIVVGGGPAGAAAAAVLARAGRSVVVVDKATFPRDKCCGDGLTTWALRELDQLGFDPSAVPSWRVVDRAFVGSPSRRLIEFPLPSALGAPGMFAAVARREELDAALLSMAERAGADVRTGTAVVGASSSLSAPAGNDGVTITLADDTTIRARHAIAADGMWSPMRRFLTEGGAATEGAKEPYLGDWHAFRQYFRNVGPLAANELFAWFEPDFLPGYAWSFPLGDGSANVGFGVVRGGRWPTAAMKTLWPEILARPHIAEVLGPDAVAEAPHKAWPIPAHVGRVPLTIGSTLFVGDAAAVTDCLTGEGIGQALATGRWAAEELILVGTPRADPGAAAVRYEARIHRELDADHAMASALSRALSHRKGARSALWLAGLSPWTRRNFARWLFEDYPRAAAFTPSRWTPGLFTGPGAFR